MTDYQNLYLHPHNITGFLTFDEISQSFCQGQQFFAIEKKVHYPISFSMYEDVIHYYFSKNIGDKIEVGRLTNPKGTMFLSKEDWKNFIFSKHILKLVDYVLLRMKA